MLIRNFKKSNPDRKRKLHIFFINTLMPAPKQKAQVM
jgi:hypothetical protein